MTVCGSIGALMVGGRVVGQLKCELEAGHDESISGPLGGFEGSPHRVVLEWADTEPVDLDLFDPAEHFDVDVPIPEAPVPFTSVYRAEAEATEADRAIYRGQVLNAPAPLNFPPTHLDRADLYGEE